MYRNLTTKELSERFGVTPRTVTSWVAQGCPVDKISIRANRFNYEEVQQWHKQRELERESVK